MSTTPIDRALAALARLARLASREPPPVVPRDRIDELIEILEVTVAQRRERARAEAKQMAVLQSLNQKAQGL